MHGGHELFDVKLDGGGEFDSVAGSEEELVAVLDVKVCRGEDGNLEAGLALMVEDGPLEEVGVAPEKAFLILVRGGDVADGDARGGDLEGGGVLVFDELPSRDRRELDDEDELVVGDDGDVLVDGAGDDAEPGLHRGLGLAESVHSRSMVQMSKELAGLPCCWIEAGRRSSWRDR